MSWHVTDSAQVPGVTTIASEVKMILFASATMLAWIWMASIDHLARLDGDTIVIATATDIVLGHNCLEVHLVSLDVQPAHAANKTTVLSHSTTNRILLSSLHLKRSPSDAGYSIELDNDSILLKSQLHIMPRSIVQLPIEWIERHHRCSFLWVVWIVALYLQHQLALVEVERKETF